MSTRELNVDRWSTPWLRGSGGRVAGVVLLGLTLGSLFMLWPVAADPAASPREITLVTRDMAFYLEGGNTPNPVLTMGAGETVRVVLRNEDVGIAHNFEVGAWGQDVPAVERGSSTSALIDAPDRPGRHVYVCGPHSALMRGIINVVAGD